MIRFESDYLEGCLPEIMERLIKTNYEQTAGYGLDPYCEAAREKIRASCAAPDAAVHFLVGGTQTNMTVIAAALRTHQGVLCAESAHIAAHETGAVEATGHKVITLPSADGKITAEQVTDYVLRHRADESFEHIAQPAMVYISQPTETGTVYSREELQKISKVCRELGLLLFVDGARLACALGLDYTPTLPELAELTDVFYIGGTKHGAMFGEAVVITNEQLMRDFRYVIKQRGGMFAKGRLLGVQFDTLFTDELYFRVGRRELKLADMIRKAFVRKEIPLFYDSPTNQLFPVLTAEQIEKLSEKYSFSHIKKLPDGRDVVRFCTSWATPLDTVEDLIEDIEEL